MFKTAAGFFSNNDDPFDDDQSEIGVKLVAQLPCKGDSLLYVYEFGDDWRHTVTHGGSSIQPRHSSVKIIAAVGACPTEDSGGVAHMPERSSNKPNLAQIQQRLDQFIELTEQQAHDHDRAFAFVMGDQDALDETDGEDFFDEEALAAFIAADEAEEFNEDELTPEQQRYQHVNEFINKPIKLTAAGYLPQHEFPVNMLYDMTSTLIPALNEEPIPASA